MPQFSKGLLEGQELKYPLTQKQIDNLPEGCKIVSPRVGKSHGIELPPRLKSISPGDEVVAEVVGAMSQAAKLDRLPDIYAQYCPEQWGEINPNRLPAPLRLAGMKARRPMSLVHAVSMDKPDDLGGFFLDWVIAEGVPLKNAPKNYVPFIELVQGTSVQIAVRNFEALNRMFEVKYYFGIPRPEEVLGLGAKFTHYKSGAPGHPASGAGHAAFSIETANVFAERFDWTNHQDQLTETYQAAWVFMQSRVAAGVHWVEDQLIACKLAGHDVNYMIEK